MNILVTGKNGQVGWELQRTLATLGRVYAVDVEDVDLCDLRATREMVRSVCPGLIVHPAAYTAVDKAEAQPDLAMAINATAPALLAEEARQVGAAIIGYSTDYVFDGSARSPYTETATPAPLNVYGRTKLAGDTAMANSGAPYVILRTSWVYGARGANFLRTMLRLGAERDELSIVADQTGAPTTARSLAEAAAQIVAVLKSRGGSLADAMNPVSGVYNAACGGETTWYGFAQDIFTMFAPQLGRSVKLKPIKTADYPTAAARPGYSVLSTEKLRNTFGVEMPLWQDAFRLVARDMLQNCTVSNLAPTHREMSAGR